MAWGCVSAPSLLPAQVRLPARLVPASPQASLLPVSLLCFRQTSQARQARQAKPDNGETCSQTRRGGGIEASALNKNCNATNHLKNFYVTSLAYEQNLP